MNNSFRLGADGIYRCDAFQQFLWQEHGFGTRAASPPAAVTLKQIHSDRVVNATGLQQEQQEGDALISSEVGKSIGIRTADCVPILLLDSRTHAIAAIHAGWRGSAAEIAKRTVECMAETFGTVPQDLYAALGPCIRGCCYEVGEEVAAKFSAMFPDWKSEDESRLTVNLVEANQRQLAAAGLASDHIFDSGLCTACQSDQFFSYRREPENPGRMIAAICRLA